MRLSLLILALATPALNVVNELDDVQGPVGGKAITNEVVNDGFAQEMTGHTGMAEQGSTLAPMIAVTIAVILDIEF
ncbi:hypothetical protein J1614_011692 [Plenodomus biglobosus]|nr:hypothetical protein J1614_011692 [Plenodomus biglobosus]